MADDATTYRDIGWQAEPTEVTDGVYYLSRFSGVTAFETDEGLVLVDSGLAELAPSLDESLREFTDAPVRAAVFTHGHADHVHGLSHFLVEGQDPPEVFAHRAVPERWARYERTQGHNDAINARQFGGSVSAADFRGEASNFRAPDVEPTTLYEDELTVRIGGVRFELTHARGETDDHTWVYCPDREVLCPGDFFISMAPNAGNPQKVQRYPWAWADALREMAGRSPRHLCPGHGSAVVDDPAGIEERLLATADYLDSIVDGAIDALNDGSPPHVDVLHAVEPPETDEPWLDEIYDEAEFIVRNVIRYYGGWWSGRPSELKPAPRADLAGEIAALAGGPEPLLDRAEELAAAGEHRLAGHLADHALEAAPEDPAVGERVAALYRERAGGASSLMAANLFRSGAAYAEEGRPYR